MERRNFLKIAGAATVATALPGCTPKEPKSLLPYIIPDEEIIPGRSVLYATVCRECPAGCGMTVRVREGRATKAEGNPLHPVNRGALCARGQAALQGLYNPDRIQTPLRKTSAGSWERITWDQAEDILVTRVKEAAGAGKGKTLAWMSPHEAGSLDRLIDDWLKVAGPSRRFRFEPFDHDAMKQANARLFGIPEIPRYDLTKADTILSFGAEILETWMSPVEMARQLAQHRGGEARDRNRLVYIGPRLSLTASNADLWLNVAPEAMGLLALSLVHCVLDQAGTPNSDEEARRIRKVVERFAPQEIALMIGVPADEIARLGSTIAAPHQTLALAGGPLLGGAEGVRTAAAVNLLNYVCGTVGKGMDFGSTSSLSRLSSYQDILDLTASMEQGRVPLLLLNDVNPVFTLPIGDRFAAAIRHVPFTVAFTCFIDETASLASLLLPLHTPLESWGDFEPYRGIHGLMQPVMEPLYGTRMLGDILLATGPRIGRDWKRSIASYASYLKEEWRAIHKILGGKDSYETFWTESLAEGGAWEHVEPRKVQLSSAVNASFFDSPNVRTGRSASTCSLVIYPSIALYDGRGANKPWLQEFPDPMTRLVWGTWVELHPEDAGRIGVHDGEAVSLVTAMGQIEAGAFISKGIRKGTIAIPMGQGHTEFGRYGNAVGANPVKLLDGAPSAAGGIQWYGTAVEIRKGQGARLFASVQETGSEHHREIVRVITVEELRSSAVPDEPEAPTIYPREPYAKHHWGMTIDLDRCTGCGACVIACYAENNIPVVGKEEVINGREMAWIRVDRYYDEEAAAEGSGRARFIPMFCQQCGAAPCETVCPVYAAYHTEEGLNGQVYNRCIGTRYCANNCPYKVRRFNWFGHEWPSPLNWQLNPDVTVRTKGVMEKCTFCVQRIVEGKNNARLEHRPVREGEIHTACQQTCPAQAIFFGDLREEQSMVSAGRRDGRRAYHVLGELNTTPAVTYLKRISDAKGS